jgi:glycosyltransferase involved in cell wall biosynthesis
LSVPRSKKIVDRMTQSLRYAVVTPARNEEEYIERTIRSVVSQTAPPMRYVIVSDGSTDKTDEIAQRYADEYDFITFLRPDTSQAGAKNFGSKVRAFNAGLKLLSDVDYNLVGNLDADVSFPPDYFANLLAKFDADPQLGLSGGAVLELVDEKPTERGASLNSVSGAVQLFRRECFEEIGGYLQLDRGGIDAAAEIMARMHGWKVRHQPDLPVVANRRVMTGQGSRFGTRYNKGAMNQRLGYHPLFQIAVSLRNMATPPLVLGGLCMLAGYAHATLLGTPWQLSNDAVRYLRAEQLSRLGLRTPPQPIRTHLSLEKRAEQNVA